MYPTLTTLPCKIDQYNEDFTTTHNGKKIPWFTKSIQNTVFSPSLNFPSISMPVSVPEGGSGMPVNMELCSDTGNDRRLLAVAKLIEEKMGIRE